MAFLLVVVLLLVAWFCWCLLLRGKVKIRVEVLVDLLTRAIGKGFHFVKQLGYSVSLNVRSLAWPPSCRDLKHLELEHRVGIIGNDKAVKPESFRLLFSPWISFRRRGWRWRV